MKIILRNSSSALLLITILLLATLCGCNTSGTAGTGNGDSTSASQLLLIPIKVLQSGGETFDGIYAFSGGPGWLEGNPGEKLNNSDLQKQMIRNGYDIELLQPEGQFSSKKYYLKYISNSQTNEYAKDLSWTLISKFPNRPTLRWEPDPRNLYIDSESVPGVTSYQIELRSEFGTLLNLSPETSSSHNYITVPTLGTYNIVFSAIKIENGVPQSKCCYVFPNKNLGNSEFSE